MRLHLTSIVALLLAQGAHAGEPLHTFPSSNIEIYATDSVDKVEASGNFVRFHLADTTIFATALVFRDTQNQYPQLAAFSGQFLKIAYKGNDYHVFSQRDVQSEFFNVTTNGREYLIDSEQGTCELVLVNPVGDRTYVHFQIADPLRNTTCEVSGVRLRAIAKKLTASIAVVEN